MKQILIIAFLFFVIPSFAQKFSSGMTKRTTVLNTDEILIKAAGTTPPQFTTPVELFAGRAVAPALFVDSLSRKANLKDSISIISVFATWDIAPASSTSAGKKGEWRYTPTASYHCYQDNHWNKYLPTAW